MSLRNEIRHWRRSGIFIVNFEHISQLVLVFLLLTLSRQMPAGYNLFFTEPFCSSKFVYFIENWEHIYIMRPKVSSNRFEISSSFQKMFRLHGDFTAATFQTIVRFYCTCCTCTNKMHMRTSYQINFNNTAQLYFTVGIYCLHGKLTSIWNFTTVKFAPKWVKMKLPYTEVKFYPEMKFQTGLSLVCVSCKHVWLREKGIKFSPSKKLLRLFKTMERDYLINLIKNTFSFTIHIID